MPDRKKVMSWLEGLVQQDWRMFHSDSEVQEIARNALELLKEQNQRIWELLCEQDKLKDMLKEQEAVTVHDPGAYCPKCGWMLYPEDHPHHCGNCGQVVKWE